MATDIDRKLAFDEQLWSVPAINVLLIRTQLAKENISDFHLLRGTGITARTLENSSTLLPYSQVAACISNAVRLTRQPALGLRLGQQESLADWGILGYAMLSCGTIREVIDVVRQFHKAAASMVEVLISMVEDVVSVELVPPVPLHETLPFVIEEHLSSFLSTMELLTGVAVPLRGVALAYSRPEYYQMYEQVFPCPVRFDQARNQVVFEAGYLDTPVTKSNRFHADIARKLCSEQLSRQLHESDFIQSVRYQILLQGSNFPDAEAIAERLHITSRTLRNRLKSQGTSFLTLLDDIRMQLAVGYLESSSLPVDEIAHLLGFSDRSNFRRAFKKWTGKLPSDFRK